MPERRRARRPESATPWEGNGMAVGDLEGKWFVVRNGGDEEEEKEDDGDRGIEPKPVLV